MRRTILLQSAIVTETTADARCTSAPQRIGVRLVFEPF